MSLSLFCDLFDVYTMCIRLFLLQKNIEFDTLLVLKLYLNSFTPISPKNISLLFSII